MPLKISQFEKVVGLHLLQDWAFSHGSQSSLKESTTPRHAGCLSPSEQYEVASALGHQPRWWEKGGGKWQNGREEEKSGSLREMGGLRGMVKVGGGCCNGHVCCMHQAPPILRLALVGVASDLRVDGED